MKKIFLILLIFTLGCSDNSPDNIIEILPEEEIDPSDNDPEGDPKGPKGYPLAWLAREIEEIEAWDPICYIRIYKGEWNNLVIYFIFNPCISGIFSKVFYDNGTLIRFETEEENFNDFLKNSKNWRLIYEYGMDFGHREAPRIGLDLPDG